MERGVLEELWGSIINSNCMKLSEGLIKTPLSKDYYLDTNTIRYDILDLSIVRKLARTPESLLTSATSSGG